MDKLVSYIPNDEKEKWKKDLKPIITEIDRLEDGAKIVGFKQEVVDKYIARKAANLFLEQLIMTDCELESANNKIDELEHRQLNIVRLSRSIQISATRDTSDTLT
jgi:hypothetical protein